MVLAPARREDSAALFLTWDSAHMIGNGDGELTTRHSGPSILR